MKTELQSGVLPIEEINEWRKRCEAAKNRNYRPPEKETTLRVEQVLLPYGVGIDTHKKFIQICVLTRHDNELHSTEREARTAWKALQNAADWIRQKLGLNRRSKTKHMSKSSNEPQKTSQKPENEPSNKTPEQTGPLIAKGIITSRTRRPFTLKKDDKTATRFQVTLMVANGPESVAVEFWSDTPTIDEKFARGNTVELPVYIRAYLKNNTARHRVCLAEPNGEPF